MKRCLCIFSFLFLIQSECVLAKGLSLFFGADLQANVTDQADKLHGKNHVFGPQAGLSPFLGTAGLFFGVGLTHVHSKVIPRVFLRGTAGGLEPVRGYHPSLLGGYGGFDLLFKLVGSERGIFHIFIGTSAGAERIGLWEDVDNELLTQTKVLARVGLSAVASFNDLGPLHGFELSAEVPVFTQYMSGNASVGAMVYRPIYLNLGYRFAF